MSTVAQDTPLAIFEQGTLFQPYMPGPSYPEPQHAGVDVSLAAYSPVLLPAAGYYQQQLSSPYQSVFALPGGGFEELLHLINPNQYAYNVLVPAGLSIGQVAPGSAMDMYTTGYAGQTLGPFTSTGPHVHIAEYLPGPSAATDAMYSLPAGSVDPTALLSSTPTGIVQTGVYGPPPIGGSFAPTATTSGSGSPSSSTSGGTTPLVQSAFSLPSPLTDPGGFVGGIGKGILPWAIILGAGLIISIMLLADIKERF